MTLGREPGVKFCFPVGRNYKGKSVSGLMLAVPHRVFDDLIHQFGVVAHRTKQRVGLVINLGQTGGVAGFPLLEQKPDGFGHRLIDRSEMPAGDLGPD